MQFSQLEYLQAVANYGGVRKAARAVHVSPQAVSSAIKKLESEYQIVLLDRLAGEAVLSPAGREFARRARVILAQVDDLKKYAQSGNGGVSPDGHFRLYAPCLELPPISWTREMGG
ncbi:MAG: LysR family transcriptional regulator, partial [Collinsella sp.]